ncbi:MAG: hypothetical protein [Caudoviricetes sp.]|nr:MAG: hypothetical protein [Caudoviricetes sp.]
MRKYIAEVIERSEITARIINSYEIPIYAKSLDEALEVIDVEYCDHEIGRVYQQVNNEVK